VLKEVPPAQRANQGQANGLKRPAGSCQFIMSNKTTIEIAGKQILLETGKMARQADGAVTVQMGETIILVAAVAAAEARSGQEFFPLTVDYREKASAAGQIPGSYFKREGRPSEKEILTCRLTDRPIRPLFPKGWFNEVQVQTLLLSADGENDPDILSILGASVALTVSDIPGAGPLGAVRVGRLNGEFVANPTHSEREESDLDLIYVGNKTDVVMYEGSAQEISEEDFIAALRFGQEACQPMIQAQEAWRDSIGKPKRDIVTMQVPKEVTAEASSLIADKVIPTLLIESKKEREAGWKAITSEAGSQLVEKFGEDVVTGQVLSDVFYKIQKEAVRKLILDEGKRLDGRQFYDIRPISSEVGLLPRAHGSALFTRGETQALTSATMGTLDDAQSFDAYAGGESEKQFILHYNFPNFSVGETGRITGPGRREIGHGALAERSIAPLFPYESFPYTVRITSEVLESNGSSSMATVCAGSLALMDAGVPLKSPAAGISIGICTQTDEDDQIDRYQILTDIIGWEDAFCDMDCKIAGSANGITGFQLDLKLKGLPLGIMEEAIQKAKEAREAVLEKMAATLAEPRKEFSKYAPRITTVRINPDKIGALIGPGGKNIKRIVEESGCEINIEDDGSVKIYSVAEDGLNIALQEIEGITAEIEVGKTYRGKVVSIKEFGAFVEVLPGQDGLCHISELANFRVKRTEDIVQMGDEIWVKVIGIDDKGRVKLSRKVAMEERDKLMADGQEASGEESAEGSDSED
jgi:polyribonucleotide nucleotidyltransferase